MPMQCFCKLSIKWNNPVHQSKNDMLSYLFLTYIYFSIFEMERMMVSLHKRWHKNKHLHWCSNIWIYVRVCLLVCVSHVYGEEQPMAAISWLSQQSAFYFICRIRASGFEVCFVGPYESVCFWIFILHIWQMSVCSWIYHLLLSLA